jgi:hypothetical protein
MAMNHDFQGRHEQIARVLVQTTERRALPRQLDRFFHC